MLTLKSGYGTSFHTDVQQLINKITQQSLLPVFKIKIADSFIVKYPDSYYLYKSDIPDEPIIAILIALTISETSKQKKFFIKNCGCGMYTTNQNLDGSRLSGWYETIDLLDRVTGYGFNRLDLIQHLLNEFVTATRRHDDKFKEQIIVDSI